MELTICSFLSRYLTCSTTRSFVGSGREYGRTRIGFGECGKWVIRFVLWFCFDNYCYCILWMRMNQSIRRGYVPTIEIHPIYSEGSPVYLRRLSLDIAALKTMLLPPGNTLLYHPNSVKRANLSACCHFASCCITAPINSSKITRGSPFSPSSSHVDCSGPVRCDAPTQCYRALQ